MDFTIEIFTHALEKNMENDLFENWKMQYPHMTEETFISFADYKAERMTRPHTIKTDEEIAAEMLRVENAFSERR